MAVEVPVLRQGPYLVASIQAELADAGWLRLQDDLLSSVGRFHSRGAVIDLTALDVLDSFSTRTLRGMAQSLKLRGAETVIVGIQPEVAMAMVQLGLIIRFEEIHTGLDLEEGLAVLDRLTGAGEAKDVA